MAGRSSVSEQLWLPSFMLWTKTYQVTLKGSRTMLLSAPGSRGNMATLATSFRVHLKLLTTSPSEVISAWQFGRGGRAKDMPSPLSSPLLEG